LEQRIKAYKRRKESVQYNTQQALLTEWRERMEELRLVPCAFERDALRRVDRGMKAFFRRVKAGQKAGFPRFRSWKRYNSMECLAVGTYLKGDRIRVPNMGMIRCRGRLLPEGKQRALRVIRKPSGWYAQVLLDDGKQAPETRPVQTAIGVDVGLNAFATMSDGSKIENPRFGRKAANKLRALQRQLARKDKGSENRKRAVKAVARQHERIADQRKYFCHQISTDLIRRYDLVAFENLNIAGMARTRFAKSILDAGWGTFTQQLTVKAANAGRLAVAVNPRGTSQECPDCGAIAKKNLSERTHYCSCGLITDRDTASARVILARAMAASVATRAVTDPTSDEQLVAASQAGRLTCVNKIDAVRQVC
jgi:putative transposase